jgi:hypothetical protein
MPVNICSFGLAVAKASSDSPITYLDFAFVNGFLALFVGYFQRLLHTRKSHDVFVGKGPCVAYGKSWLYVQGAMIAQCLVSSQDVWRSVF